jgi:translation initiation factor IF-2
LAEKIRNKYFPKKETIAKRGVRVVKRAERAVEETPALEAAEAGPEAEASVSLESAQAETAPPAPAEAPKQPAAARLIRKLSPAVRAEQPAADAGATVAPPAGEAFVEVEEPGMSPAESGVPEETVVSPGASTTAAPVQPPARQVRVLRPTMAALNAGIRPGERAPSPVVPPSITPKERAERGTRVRERTPLARTERLGTPGETLTPQTTYIPPPDAGRRRSRRAPARGGRKIDGKAGRFDKGDFIPPPKALSLEDRIAGRLDLTAVPGELKPARLIEGSTVKEFAEKLGIKPKDVVTLLLQRGVFATINQPLNDDVAVDLGQRFGYEVTFVPFEEMVAEEEFEELIATDADDVELPRAPVVTVMGHVDHGKTSLLDAIRTTEVAAGEAGGITQHIGAYSVQVPSPDHSGETRRVVFLDTPGHEAFTLMRARGAKATDVVVLVVAADDGVMPQTIEAIEHSRAANVPIVVAINKIDKPDANPDRVRQELAKQGLNPVEWGGETEMVQVSAKKRENLETLLETILLTSDILNLRASPTRLASGVVLEAKLDRGRGAVATVLVQQGTLRIHEPFIVGQIFGRVRAMFNDKGEAITEAAPATPVEVLGLQGVPQAGESFQVVADIARAQQISGHRQMVSRQATLLQTTKRGIEALGESEVKELLVVIKADVQGSVEVLKSTLQKLSTDRVKVKVIRSGVGAITESDVLLASATQAGSAVSAVVVIGFNVRPGARAADLAKQESVDIRLHSIIYKVEEEIRAAMIGMLEAIEKERIIGKADVREVFRVPKAGVIGGSMVIDGNIRRNARARLIRDGVVSWEGNIASLRRFKDDVSEVREGFECGIGLENFNDLKVGDQIEAYVVEKVAATEL